MKYLEKNNINIDELKKIIKNSWETKNQYEKHGKSLTVKGFKFKWW